MVCNIFKVNWWDEELDIYYRNMGHPKSVWKNNEGLPYGIYYYFDREADPLNIECRWYATEQERDKVFAEDLKNETSN